MMIHSYCLHNFLDIEIEQQTIPLHVNYEHYFSQFRTNERSSSPEYVVREYNTFHLPEPHFHFGNANLGFMGGVCFPFVRYAITYDGHCLTEYTNEANRATNLNLQTHLINKGLSFIHCAGVELAGKGIIFPAFGGVGKTTVVSSLRTKPDFKLFGDDYVIVDDQGYMYSYPCDFSIYDYHINLFPELQNSVYQKYLHEIVKYNKYEKLLHKSRLLFPLADLFNRVYPRPLPINASNEWRLGYVKVPVNEIIPAANIGNKIKLSASVFLERYNGSELIMESMAQNVLVKDIMSILSCEFKDEMYYLHSLSKFCDLDTTAQLVKQKHTLRKSMSNIDCYKLLIPLEMKPSDLAKSMDQFLKQI